MACAMPAAFAQTSSLSETVVTATRFETRVDDLVSDVSVVDRAAIEASTARTLPELLAREAGVQFTSNGGFGQQSAVFIRGTETRHTILLIDGVRYGSATTGTPIWETLPIEAIERIEMVKGPSSALYGADGAGGVVQVFTRQPKDGYHPSASVTLGSRSHQRVSAGVAGGQGDLGYSVGVQHLSDGGLSATNANSGSFNADADPFRQSSFNGSVRYKLNRDWKANASVLYSDGQNHFDDGPGSDGRTRLRGAVAQAGLTGRLSPDWQTEFRLGRSNDTNNYIQPAAYGSLVTRESQWTWQNTIATSLGAVLAGLERRDQKVDSNQVFAVTARTIDAAFVGLNGQADAHSWQVNARHDRNSQFGAADTGFAGYGYRFSPAWRVHTSYGTSFVAPSFNDLYSPWGTGNPALQPERGRNLDLGVTWTAGVHEVKLVRFDNRIRNAFVNDNFWVRHNVGLARIDGWTLAYAGSLAGYHLRASLDELDARDAVSGNRLQRRARHQATLGADTGVGAWRLGGSLLYVGQRFDDTANTVSLGGYATLDAHATWKLSQDLSLQFKVNNLADRAYETVRGYNQPGRSFYTTLRWQPK